MMRTEGLNRAEIEKPKFDLQMFKNLFSSMAFVYGESHRILCAISE